MCSLTPAAYLDLPLDTRAAGVARRFLNRAMCATHFSSVQDDAQLLISELVTNAVLYGGQPITVEAECDESIGMQVRVSDGAPVGSLAPVQAGTADEGGRGLALVDLLSNAWGVDATARGKTVWFRIRP